MLTQIHLMELPNPDPTAPEQRPEHGGRDRHICVGAQPCRERVPHGAFTSAITQPLPCQESLC